VARVMVGTSPSHRRRTSRALPGCSAALTQHASEKLGGPFRKPEPPTARRSCWCPKDSTRRRSSRSCSSRHALDHAIMKVARGIEHVGAVPSSMSNGAGSLLAGLFVNRANARQSPSPRRSRSPDRHPLSTEIYSPPSVKLTVVGLVGRSEDQCPPAAHVRPCQRDWRRVVSPSSVTVASRSCSLRWGADTRRFVVGL